MSEDIHVGNVDIEPFGPDVRHVDVAILYGLGMRDRAHYLAKQLRRREQPVCVGFAGGRDSSTASGTFDTFKDAVDSFRG